MQTMHYILTINILYINNANATVMQSNEIVIQEMQNVKMQSNATEGKRQCVNDANAKLCEQCKLNGNKK